LDEYEFPCGCRWPVLGPPPAPGLPPLIDIDQDGLPECASTYALLATGRTKGVFQLEKRLGQDWAKRLAPESVEHLAALGALLRPGALNAKDDRGVSMTEVYCRRKNGEEPADAYLPALQDILAPTYQVIAYQEQVLRIAGELAGMDANERDKLRAALGKKDEQEFARCRDVFRAGVKATGVVTPDEGDAVWAWVKESSRYLFNKSHSVSYALTGYETAYLKAHAPHAFYANWLLFAKDGADPKEEVAELVRDARHFGVKILPPDFRLMRPLVSLDGAAVRFGLTDVRGMGDSTFDRVEAAVRAAEGVLGRPTAEWGWVDFLLYAAPEFPAAAKAMALAGALDWSGLTRKRMAAELDATSVPRVTKAEMKRVHAAGPHASCLAALEWLLSAGKMAPGRPAKLAGEVAVLKSPLASERDTPAENAAGEEWALGVAVTCSRTDGFDLSGASSTCRAFANGAAGDDRGRFKLAVAVEEARVTKTKAGKTPGAAMAYLAVGDATGSLEGVQAFPEAWAACGKDLREGAAVMLVGRRDARRGNFVVDSARPLTPLED
jgi:DNA polymerase III alpha subunit